MCTSTTHVGWEATPQFHLLIYVDVCACALNINNEIFFYSLNKYLDSRSPCGCLWKEPLFVCSIKPVMVKHKKSTDPFPLFWVITIGYVHGFKMFVMLTYIGGGMEKQHTHIRWKPFICSLIINILANLPTSG